MPSANLRPLALQLLSNLVDRTITAENYGYQRKQDGVADGRRFGKTQHSICMTRKQIRGKMVIDMPEAICFNVLHCRFSGIAIADGVVTPAARPSIKLNARPAFPCAHRQYGYGYVKDPGGDFDQFSGMPHQHYLAKSQPYRLFNHVADKIALVTTACVSTPICSRTNRSPWLPGTVSPALI